MYVNPDILGFDGDIDSCKEYNWCELLIKKLISTHKYWIQKPSRSFTGPLPFLIYLYIDRLSDGRDVDVVRKLPAYKAWSDLLVRDRQKYEKEHKTFGIGVILQWPDEESPNEVYGEPLMQRKDDTAEVLKSRLEAVNEQAEPVFGEPLMQCKDDTEVLKSRLEAVHRQSELVLSEDEALDDSLDEQNLIDYYEDVVGQLEQVSKEVYSVHTTAFLLYPDNPKIMELKSRVMNTCARDMYHSQTPQETPCVHKSSSYNIPQDSQPPLPTQFYIEMDRISAERFKPCSINPKEDDIPSFSLGLSQSVQRNLNECSKPENDCEENVEQITGIEGIECKQDIGSVLNRPRRELKLSEKLRSPYVSRVINISTRIITRQENAVWEWLFLECENVFENLFEWNDRACTVEQLRTLKENEMIMGNVINCWTYLLNENERRRSNCSPLRLFCGIETTYGPLHDPFSKVSYICFTENMDIVTCMTKYMHGRQLAEEDFDMFFFPIYANSHHYLIVYNVKHPSWEIIDNIEGSQDVVQRYGTLPFNLHNYFIRWMKELMIPAWVRMCNLQPVIIDMSWQTEENGVDCGIFVMRHMETYMGTSVSEWDIGLAKESARQKRQLDKLRIIYCFELLTNRLNGNRGEIIEAAERYIKGKVDDVVDVDSRGRKIMKTYKRIAAMEDKLLKK